jgi:hypothetical protein
LATVNRALAVADIDGDGERDLLVPSGILWMQGESDGTVTEEVAQRYGEHLKRLMDLIRAVFRSGDLPVIIGRISDSGKGDHAGGKVWKYGDIVREQQTAFVRNDRNASLVVTTDAYQYSDKWHYDSAGFLDLGRQFALAFFALTNHGQTE